MFSWSSRVFAASILSAVALSAQSVPRTANGKPNLQGIWQAQTRAAYDLQDHGSRQGMPAGRSVVDGGTIPYLPATAAKKLANYVDRKTLDPLGKCFFP